MNIRLSMNIRRIELELKQIGLKLQNNVFYKNQCSFLVFVKRLLVTAPGGDDKVGEDFNDT